MILIVEYNKIEPNWQKKMKLIEWMNVVKKYFYTHPVEYKYVILWDQIAMSLLDLMLLFTI